MKYRITLEVNDPEGAMGDSPPLEDLKAWAFYLDIEEDELVRVALVEMVAA